MTLQMVNWRVKFRKTFKRIKTSLKQGGPGIQAYLEVQGLYTFNYILWNKLNNIFNSPLTIRKYFDYDILD